MPGKKNNMVPIEDNGHDNNSDIENNIDISGLTDSQRQFLAVRPYHHTDSKAAEAIDMSASSIYTWKLMDPAFKDAYSKTLAKLFDVDSAIARQTLQSNMIPASEKYAEIISIPIIDKNNKPLVTEGVLKEVRTACKDVLQSEGIVRGTAPEKVVRVGIDILFAQEVHADKWHKPVDGDYEVLEDAEG